MRVRPRCRWEVGEGALELVGSARHERVDACDADEAVGLAVHERADLIVGDDGFAVLGAVVDGEQGHLVEARAAHLVLDVLELGDAVEVDVERLVAQVLLALVPIDRLVECRKDVDVDEHGKRLSLLSQTGEYPLSAKCRSFSEKGYSPI